MNGKKIGYWATTGLLSLVYTFGATMELSHASRMVETVTHLGYPTYLLGILGTWKLLGVVALLSPRGARLKEWAYAGIVFDLTGALVSHATVGDGAAKLAPPLVLLALAIASWSLRPASRKLQAPARNAAAQGTQLPSSSYAPIETGDVRFAP